MVRRKGIIGHLLRGPSRLPWWAAVILAVVVFLALHFLAAAPSPTTGAEYLPALRAAASILQYLLPIALLLGAAAAFVRRSRLIFSFSRILVNPVSKVSTMSWSEFEPLVVEMFRQRGFQIIRDPEDAATGLGLTLMRGEERFLVQCKQWRAQQVGEAVVRELHALLVARGASGGFVVTSGRFTRDAHQLAGACSIELIDGVSIDELSRGADAAGAAGPIGKAAERNTQTGS